MDIREYAKITQGVTDPERAPSNKEVRKATQQFIDQISDDLSPQEHMLLTIDMLMSLKVRSDRRFRSVIESLAYALLDM